MNAPSGVRFTAILMFALIVVGIAVFFTQPMPQAQSAPTSATLLSVFRIGAVVLGVIEAVIVFFYMKGQNWARWLVMIDSVWQLLLLIVIGKAMRTSHVSAALVVFNAILAAYLLYYLNTAEAKGYFTAPKAA